MTRSFLGGSNFLSLVNNSVEFFDVLLFTLKKSYTSVNDPNLEIISQSLDNPAPLFLFFFFFLQRLIFPTTYEVYNYLSVN